MDVFSRSKMLEVAQALTPEPERAASLPVHLIRVNAVLTKLAVLYEKIRTAVDYKEDHALRKAAITRILKRQLTLEHEPKTIAERLIRELISAGYLPNGALPEELIERAAGIIGIWLAIRGASADKVEHLRWAQGVVSAALEEQFDARLAERRLTHFLFEQLGDRIIVAGLDAAERRLQISVACHRLLLKADDEMLAWMIVKTFFPEWSQTAAWSERPRDMTRTLCEIEARVRRVLRHPLQARILGSVKPWAVSLMLLRDVLLAHPEQRADWVEHPERLSPDIARAAERRYKESRLRLRRGTLRAIIYLFFTKMLLALALEIPFEVFFYQRVARGALLVNVLFPPLLMLIVGSMIQVPGKDNQLRIQRGVEELLSESGPAVQEIRARAAAGNTSALAFGFLYALMFALTFGGLFMLLLSLHFTWVSALIFLFFLCVVSFFAFRLRQGVREYVVIEKKDSLGSTLVDFFSLPVLRAGQWLSQTISRLNVFLFLFDFIIETPYKIFLNVLEDWFAYLKEKKEELR